MKMLPPYTTRLKKYTTIIGCGLLTVWLANFTGTALLCSCWQLFSWRCCSLRFLLLSTSYRKPASLYGRTDPVPARHGRTSQVSAFYSNVSTLLKSRRPIKITKNGQSTVYLYNQASHQKMVNQKVLRISV
jgi:hypothetical protein